MVGKALVIGGAGFLGSGIVAELVRADWQVASLGRGNKPNREARVRFIQADRHAPGGLGAALGGEVFDLVVDCAAYQQPDAEDAVATFARTAGHYVFISTDFVYAPTIDGGFPIEEDAPKEQRLPYGTGKLACEAVLTRAWQERRFPGTTLRPPHIIGAGSLLGSGSVQGRDAQLVEHLRAGTDLTLIAEGQLLIQPVWNRQVGAGIAHLAGNERAFGEIFNGAGGECVTTRRYYALIAELLGVPLRFDAISLDDYLARWPDKAPFARHRCYSLRHLEERTGYRPHLPLRDALAQTLAGLREGR